MTDLIDILAPAPQPRRMKASSNPWNGPEGQTARLKGVQTEGQFLTLQAIEEEAQRTSNGAEGLSRIAELAGVSTDEATHHLSTLKLAGLIRETRSGGIGRVAFYPVNT